MVAERTVGVRELKANLSRYLKLVKEGETVVVSERGKPIARLARIRPTLEQRLMEMVASGEAEWGGQRPEPREPVAVNSGSKLASDIIVEDRDWPST